MQSSRSKRLWGQDIEIVRGGLNEEQVVGFVNDLIVKYKTLLERQEHFLSLGTLSEKAAVEADKMASDIKNRAKEEANSMAMTIVSQTTHRAQEMIANAKKRAQEVTKAEADGLLESANRKANLIETEAKQRSQLYLIRARSVIEEDLKRQFIEVYEQLLSILRELLGQGHDIESSWKAKIVELWKRENLELDSYEAVPSVLASEITRASGFPKGEYQMRPSPRPTYHPANDEFLFDFPFKGYGQNKGQTLVDDDLSFLQTTSSADQSRAANQVQEAPVQQAVQNAEEFESAAAQNTDLNGKQEAATALMDEIDTSYEQESVIDMPVSEPAPVEFRTQAKIPAAYMGEFEGELDVKLVAPVDLSVMSKIYTELQNKHEVKILRTIGSYDKGTTITLFLEKPLKLVEMLYQIPGVEVSTEGGGKLGFLKKAVGGNDHRGSSRTVIPLRTQR